jgi:hypothetical protein
VVLLGGGRLLQGRSLTMGMKGRGECKVFVPIISATQSESRNGRSPSFTPPVRRDGGEIRHGESVKQDSGPAK